MKKVLFATDASEASLRAARTLGGMARLDPDLTVTVLHVVPLPEVLTPAAAAGAPLTLPGKLDDYLQTKVQEVLRRSVEALEMEPHRVRTQHIIGIAGDAILSEQKLGGYDLVVMGRRGLSPLREIFLGSVSQAVIHRATCPVLLVP